ncbi:S9 family peptidase [Chloroflexus sp.]|uniref:S9 family peptidase n=1 Tax=Chloroflexus sp. TaxID=1904827 RepID=UPI00298F2460|nr:S9 family peptidase [Chloroflexus sp.]MCS6886876.1 S9 family peptidase [Chloroflexus sp.]MDW8403898.1 S9 family peptidase [Chloroflexus sp.]
MTTPTLSRFKIDDLYELGWLEDPRLSPDGQLVAVVWVTVDRVNNGYHRQIALVSTVGGPLRRFTRGKQDRQPRWSPDGKWLAFVSNRDDERGQIYIIPVNGGEAQQLTNMPNGASDPAWSPDGRWIAFLSPVNAEEQAREDAGETPPPPADAWEARRAREQRQHEEELRHDPRVVTKLPYRSGTSYFDDRRRHIYMIEVNPEAETSAIPRRLTSGDLHYSAPVWMPAGDALLSTATRDPEADSLFAYYDVVRIPIDGSLLQALTRPGFSYFDPQPSPDGSQIAFLRLNEERLLGEGRRVAIIPAEGGEPHDLTAHTDLNVEQFHWQPDGQGVLFSAGWRGEAHVYQIGLPGTPTYRNGATLVGGPRIVSEFDVGRDGSIAFVAGSAENPCDLFFRSADGHERRLTAINDRLLSQRLIAPIEEIVYLAPDGNEVQGWVLHPPDFDPANRYPLAVYIHGGPHVMWGPGFRTMWHEWQVAAARGYVVFFCNPRGSEGYGELWRDAIRGKWGEADAPDILAGIDALVARGYIDPQRIAVTGGSYGGYMTAWLIGHDDRFACAVAARGVYNLLTQHSTSDAHELIEIEFGGFPWELYEELWDHSPLAHAHKITTPLLLLHSELDYRVPISEAEQLFAILRRQKKVVELVRYPREGHELTRSGEPRHRADHMRRTLEWFDRYCRGE